MYVSNYSRKGFTLLELVIVVIIVAVLAGLGIPQFQGAVIKSKIAEIYPVISAITKGEDMYYAQYECYPSALSTTPCKNNLLGSSSSQSSLDIYSALLGVTPPGPESEFIYGVYYNNASVYVYTRTFEPGKILCIGYTIGPKRGKIAANTLHPWYKYVQNKDTSLDFAN